MINTRDIDGIIGSDALDQDNDRIGKVGQVYLDSESEQPVWVSVKSGLFGTSETLVPLDGADWDSRSLHLAFSKDRVKDAPRVEPDAELSPEEQDRLYDYYGIGQDGAGQSGAGRDGTGQDLGGAAGTQAGDTGFQQQSAGSGTRSSTGEGLRQDSDQQSTGIQDTAAASGAAGAGYDTSGRGADADYDTTTGRGAGADDVSAAGRGADAGRTTRDADYSGTTGRGADSDTTSTGSGADFASGRDGVTDDLNRNDHGTQGHDTSGPTTDDAMTRSEERLNVGTQKVEAGRARLRKYVVTEQQTVDVPVSHEEVRVEREPITDANRGDAYDGPELSDEEHEVVLTEERPVVEKETVPVERVRLATEEVTGNQQVSEDVRHEEIEQVDDGARGATGRDADGRGRTDR